MDVKDVLVFGCRLEGEDYYYKEEWMEMEEVSSFSMPIIPHISSANSYAVLNTIDAIFHSTHYDRRSIWRLLQHSVERRRGRFMYRTF